jgi:uncharacterized membrane protein
MNSAIWTELAATLAMAVLLHFLPRLARPGVFFGVTVAPEFENRAEGRRILSRYRAWVWGAAAAALAPTAIGIFALGPALPVIAGLLAFVQANRAAKPHAAGAGGVREAVLAPPPPGLTKPMLAGMAAPFAILAAAAVRLWLRQEELPARLPVHWGWDGRPDRWIEGTPTAAAAVLAANFAVLSVLAATILLIAYRTRRIATAGPAAQAELRFRRLTIWTLITAQFLLAMTGAWVVLPAFAPWILLAPVIVLTVLLIRMGQGGARTARDAPAGDRTPDRCWKWGLVYVNPDDPALIVEKRFGIGYTLNFAHPAAWAIMAALLLPLVLLGLLR